VPGLGVAEPLLLWAACCVNFRMWFRYVRNLGRLLPLFVLLVVVSPSSVAQETGGTCLKRQYLLCAAASRMFRDVGSRGRAAFLPRAEPKTFILCWWMTMPQRPSLPDRRSLAARQSPDQKAQPDWP